MFFLATNTLTFPITLPADFVAGVSMNAAVRQPIELLYPHKYRFRLPRSTASIYHPPSSRPAHQYGRQTANL